MTNNLSKKIVKTMTIGSYQPKLAMRTVRRRKKIVKLKKKHLQNSTNNYIINKIHFL